MTESVLSTDERATSLALEALSNPVVLGVATDRMHSSLPYLVLPKRLPTKYRRPSEGRRDSFGVGLALMQRFNRASRAELRNSGPSIKAISRRYPLTGDCFEDGGAIHDRPSGASSLVMRAATRSFRELVPAPPIKAVPIGQSEALLSSGLCVADLQESTIKSMLCPRPLTTWRVASKEEPYRIAEYGLTTRKRGVLSLQIEQRSV